MGHWVACLLRKPPCSADMPGPGRSQPTCSITRALRRARLPVSLGRHFFWCTSVTAAQSMGSCIAVAHASRLQHQAQSPASGA